MFKFWTAGYWLDSASEATKLADKLGTKVYLAWGGKKVSVFDAPLYDGGGKDGSWKAVTT